MFIKFIKKISSLKSIKNYNGKESSSRISSYLLLKIIWYFALFVLSTEIIRGTYSLFTGTPYLISNEFIIVFGSLLTHHLALLGINKAAESKEQKINKEND